MLRSRFFIGAADGSLVVRVGAAVMLPPAEALRSASAVPEQASPLLRVEGHAASGAVVRPISRWAVGWWPSRASHSEHAPEDVEYPRQGTEIPCLSQASISDLFALVRQSPEEKVP